MKLPQRTIRLMSLVLCAYGLLWATQARATVTGCSFPTNNVPINISLPATVTVPTGAQVGTVLANANNTPIVSDKWRCTLNGTATSVNMAEKTTVTRFTSLSSYGNSVYNTNIPGIGIQITANSMPSPFPTSLSYTDDYVGGTIGFSSSASGMSANAKLIVTGNVTAGGTVTAGQIGTYSATIQSSYSATIATVNLTGTTTINAQAPPTCSVNANSTQVVSLGAYTTTQFTGVGSMTSPKAFNINFNCSGGTSGQSRKIYITMTDATVPSNRTSNLNLATGSTAGGVAVRIQRNAGATDVLFGADSATIGNTNQWQAGTVATGTSTFSVPLQARLVQTGTLKTGSVSAKATFTVAYN